jgi:tetratricopeptide (TPR) repeat protein
MTAPRLEQLRKARQQRPEDPFLTYAIAIELVNEGLDAEARPLFEELLERHQSYVPTYLHAGMLFERGEETRRAKEIYMRGIEVAQSAGNSHAASELRGALAALPE